MRPTSTCMHESFASQNKAIISSFHEQWRRTRAVTKDQVYVMPASGMLLGCTAFWCL